MHIYSTYCPCLSHPEPRGVFIRAPSLPAVSVHLHASGRKWAAGIGRTVRGQLIGSDVCDFNRPEELCVARRLGRVRPLRLDLREVFVVDVACDVCAVEARRIEQAVGRRPRDF